MSVICPTPNHIIDSRQRTEKKKDFEKDKYKRKKRKKRSRKNKKEKKIYAHTDFNDNDICRNSRDIEPVLHDFGKILII